MITLFWRGRTVRLIRLEKRSLSVGKNFGLAKTLSVLQYKAALPSQRYGNNFSSRLKQVVNLMSTDW